MPRNVRPAPVKKYGKSFPVPKSCGNLYLVGSNAAAAAPAMPPPTLATTALIIHFLAFCNAGLRVIDFLLCLPLVAVLAVAEHRWAASRETPSRRISQPA